MDKGRYEENDMSLKRGNTIFSIFLIAIINHFGRTYNIVIYYIISSASSADTGHTQLSILQGVYPYFLSSYITHSW